MRRLLALLVLALSPGLAAAETKTAVFGGGCFWCLEADFEKLPGVISAVSGYAGGKEANPTYEAVSAHRTGHVEVVEIRYDAAQLTYAQVLDWFWRHVDPLTPDAQFCDQGPQYRTVIFHASEEEKALALETRAAHEKKLGRPIVTQIVPAARFWPAEDYHQDYAKKNPLRYKYYRLSCGRDRRVEEVWGKH